MEILQNVKFYLLFASILILILIFLTICLLLGKKNK